MDTMPSLPQGRQVQPCKLHPKKPQLRSPPGTAGIWSRCLSKVSGSAQRQSGKNIEENTIKQKVYDCMYIMYYCIFDCVTCLPMRNISHFSVLFFTEDICRHQSRYQFLSGLLPPPTDTYHAKILLLWSTRRTERCHIQTTGRCVCSQMT